MLLLSLSLRTYLFQFLFIFVTIAIEAFVIHRGLRVTRRVSLEYAISLNLFSTVIGWMIFFQLESLIPPQLKVQLVSYMVSDEFLPEVQEAGSNTFLILTAFLTFLITFVVELRGLDLLDFIREGKKPELSEEPTMDARTRRRLAWMRIQVKAPRNQTRASTILLANACSYSVISLVLLARILSAD
ncbi:MAG: hypothetical protein SFW36_03880 [Leptolyngbyaceae cyanobacterium bins.59]|nr:hypothetical protein [Leptolyngbyaceae cyanobacterium bins.59]